MVCLLKAMGGSPFLLLFVFVLISTMALGPVSGSDPIDANMGSSPTLPTVPAVAAAAATAIAGVPTANRNKPKPIKRNKSLSCRQTTSSYDVIAARESP